MFRSDLDRFGSLRSMGRAVPGNRRSHRDSLQHSVTHRSYTRTTSRAAARKEWRRDLKFIIWVETPRAERHRRGLERDGADALDFWEARGAAEDTHYGADPTKEHADIVVDGTGPMDFEEFTVGYQLGDPGPASR